MFGSRCMAARSAPNAGAAADAPGLSREMLVKRRPMIKAGWR